MRNSDCRVTFISSIQMDRRHPALLSLGGLGDAFKVRVELNLL